MVFILGSLIFGVLWSVLKHGIQSAFSIAAYSVTALGGRVHVYRIISGVGTTSTIESQEPLTSTMGCLKTIYQNA